MGQGQSTTAKRMSIQEMDEYLASQCTRISAFNQRGPGKGICHGMCLDWVRRILSGKTSRFNKYDGNPDGAAKRKQKMSQIHDLRATALQDTIPMLQGKLQASVRQAKAAINDPMANLEPIRLEINTLKAELIDCKKMGTSHPVFWKTFGELWNAAEKNKHGDKKQANFDSINGAIFESYQKVMDWDDFFKNIANNTPVKQCSIALMNDPDPADRKSHAIALYRSSPSVVEFFDPNFGEFTMDVSKVGNVFDILMRNIYPTYEEASRASFS